MSIKRLAELTGTSPGTVSKAFSDSPEISEYTKERIFEAAKERGWFHKYYKGPRQRDLVGILCPETDSEHYASMVDRLVLLLEEQGKDTVICVTRFDPRVAREYFSRMTGCMGVKGVVALGDWGLLQNPDGIPLVILGSRRGRRTPLADFVSGGMEDALASAVRLAKEKGHRSIGFIGEPLTGGKETLWRSILRREGLAVQDGNAVTVQGRFEEGGYRAMESFFAKGALPSVIFAAYDAMARGAMRCVRERGLSVPEDISFVGMDDNTVDAYLDAPLTSVCNKTEEVCRALAELILSGLQRGAPRGCEICVPGWLALRGTLGEAPKEKSVFFPEKH